MKNAAELKMQSMCKDSITSYDVYPGIKLVYFDIYSRECVKDLGGFEICHCREGRIEYDTGDKYSCLMPGDIAVMDTSSLPRTAYFPTSRYKGISVIFDLDKVPKCLSCFLDDVNVSPHRLAEKFCGERPIFIARSDPRTEHIFSELYNVPENLKKGYFKVKVLELTLFLTAFDMTADETDKHSYSVSNAILAKDVREYLIAHMSEKVTLDELSSELHVSGTQIKNTFKKVFGESVYSYIRIVKMQMAADLIVTTDKTITEVAGMFGYDNASKFSSAFRDVMGLSPIEYRKEKMSFGSLNKAFRS